MNDKKKLIGRRISAARHLAGYTQSQLAEKVGVARTTIPRWESGERVPSSRIRLKLAEVLQIPVCQLDPKQDYADPAERLELYEQLRDRFGVINQLRKWGEEASELCTALQQLTNKLWANGELDPFILEKVIEEVADCRNMDEQASLVLLKDRNFSQRVEEARARKARKAKAFVDGASEQLEIDFYRWL